MNRLLESNTISSGRWSVAKNNADLFLKSQIDSRLSIIGLQGRFRENSPDKDSRFTGSIKSTAYFRLSLLLWWYIMCWSVSVYAQINPEKMLAKNMCFVRCWDMSAPRVHTASIGGKLTASLRLWVGCVSHYANLADSPPFLVNFILVLLWILMMNPALP